MGVCRPIGRLPPVRAATRLGGRTRITELLRWVKPRLPAGYRAYIGSAPTIAVGAPAEKPDLGIRSWSENPMSDGTAPPASLSGNGESVREEPDEEIAVAMLDPGTSLYI